MQQRLGLQARSLIEMTPLIEKYLSKILIDTRLKAWLEDIKTTYRIETLLFQEGSDQQKTTSTQEKSR